MSGPEELGFDRLADWAEGRLPEEEAREVEERVARGSEEARRDAQWLRAFVAASESTVLASPPPGVREELVRRFRAHAAGERRPGFFRAPRREPGFRQRAAARARPGRGSGR